jgi:hypothetical protein
MEFQAIDIQCPHCGKLAKFEEPFIFQGQREIKSQELTALAGHPQHRWGSWTVIERFPSEYPWHPPATFQRFLRYGAGEGGYPLLTHGLIRCSHCYIHQKHTLNWPQDAYWQWQIRGETLWAWDKPHAQAILNHIQQAQRPPRNSYGLRYIPSHFLTAKVRDLVVKKITETILASAEP